MKIFEMHDYNLNVSPEAWGLLPFKAILKKDKSRQKETAFKEMLFIYYYLDIRSDYMYITNDKIREEEIIKDIGLDPDWEIGPHVENAMEFYKKFITPIQKLYKSSLKSVDDVSEYLEKTGELLAERSANGSTVTTLAMVTQSLKSVPLIMRDLKAAYKEVLAEQKELEGRTKGSKTMGLFEEGLQFD